MNVNIPMLVVMGICGCGKSTIGTLLADRLNLPFYDGDDFHPEANVAKMSAGEPLTDADRQPWLECLAAEMKKWHAEGGAVLACSALKERYRTILKAECPDAVMIFLDGSKEVILERMEKRTDHFFPPGLIDTQLAALEQPKDAIVVDIREAPEQVVDSIIAQRAERDRN